MRTLTQAGLNDARVMPESDAGRRVSVGLFSERGRAERRARALRRLGLEPEIGERHVPGSVYWVDIDLGPDDSSVSTEGLLEPGKPAQGWKCGFPRRLNRSEPRGAARSCRSAPRSRQSSGR